MPTRSQLHDSLKIMDRTQVKILSGPHTKAARQHLTLLSFLRDHLEAEQYWERPPTYRRVHYRIAINPLIASQPNEFKFLFRMSSSEFARLVTRFGCDEVFQTTGKRPQAPPKYQLALFIHHLAHGYKVRAEARLFGISGLYFSVDRILSDLYSWDRAVLDRPLHPSYWSSSTNIRSLAYARRAVRPQSPYQIDPWNPSLSRVH